jgi:methyl-accepting chemotaxis protein
MFKKIMNTILNPFKKLKVIYQILIVIGIMIAFSTVQCLVGIHVIHTLNTNSKIVVDKSMNLVIGLKELQGNFLALQMGYSNDVAKSDNTIQSLNESSLGPLINSEIAVIKGIDPNALKVVEEKYKTVQEILARPVNLENYQELEGVMLQIKLALQQSSEKVVISTYAAIMEGKSFSDLAILFTILLLIIGTFLAIGLGFLIAFSISRPLNLVKIIADALAEGDLTKTISAKGSREVVSVIESLNQAIGGLRELVGNIDEQSNTLFTASQELKNASNETGRSAAEVAQTMGELANASSEEAEQVNQTVENINSLAGMVREVSDELKNVSADSENIARSAQLGQKVASDVAEGITNIYNTTKEVNEVIDELDKASGEISDITTMIEGIAEQTTLLALNASIEAARAGEQGKGFAVVAIETGKLADQSKQAAQLINQLVNQMKTRTSQAVNSIKSGMSMVEAGKNLAVEATVTFENIFKKLGESLDRIDTVALSAKNMAARNENVITAVTSIATLSEEGMASTEEVSAITQEQSASVEEVSALAENLAQISVKLKQSVAKFEIEGNYGR